MELILLGLLAGVGVASYALWTRARALREAPPPPRRLETVPAGERTAASLEPEDVVQHFGTDWVVEGVIGLGEDGRGARLSAVTDGSHTRYLFASNSAADPAFLDPAPELRIEGQPETVRVGTQTFAVTTRGTVAAERRGTILGQRGKGDPRVSYAEYASGSRRLVMLRWGEDAEIFLGERIPSHQLEILAAK